MIGLAGSWKFICHFFGASNATAPINATW